MPPPALPSHALPAPGPRARRTGAHDIGPHRSATAPAAGLTRRDLARLALRQCLPLALSAGLVALLWQNFADIDGAEVLAAATRIPAWGWPLALAATLASFLAIGRYDGVLHRQLATGLAPRLARRAGMTAIAVSQALGLGTLTGTLVRWRMCPGMTPWQALRLSAAVSLSFVAGWGLVAAGAVLVFGPPLPWTRALALAVALILAALLALSLWPPRVLARFPMPALRGLAEITLYSALDLGFAALAFWALLPEGHGVPAGAFACAFVFAMGAGLIGGTPGGLGPFEAALLALLPAAPAEPLLAAALAFRLVFHALPAMIALPLVLRGGRGAAGRAGAVAPGAPVPAGSPAPPALARQASPFLPPRLEVQLFAAPRAEVNLLRQGEFALLSDRTGAPLALAAPLGQSLVMLSDPIPRRFCLEAALGELQAAARARLLMPAIYKCGARMAVMARRAGWQVLPVAQEAWLTPRTFTPDGAGRRQLRRALRKAEAAGLAIEEAGRDLPLAEMETLAAEWAGARGGERGFSMGRFDRDYVTCQRVFLARLDGRLVGFITLHETRNEMTLDLMRQGADAPEGTMQALVVAAIGAAADYGCPRLSLAAIPWQGRDAAPLVARLRGRLAARSGAAGLIRFKRAFDPRYETLYAAAPGRIGLALAGLAILRRITAPPPRRGFGNPMALRLPALGSGLVRRRRRGG